MSLSLCAVMCACSFVEWSGWFCVCVCVRDWRLFVCVCGLVCVCAIGCWLVCLIVCLRVSDCVCLSVCLIVRLLVCLCAC